MHISFLLLIFLVLKVGFDGRASTSMQSNTSKIKEVKAYNGSKYSFLMRRHGDILSFFEKLGGSTSL